MKRLRVFAGVGTRVVAVGRDVSLVAKSSVRWPHAWKCSLSGNELSVRLGLVNGIEPFLSGRLMSGKDKEGNDYPEGVPMLKLKEDEFDDTGRSFICVRLKVDADGKFPEKEYQAEDLFILQTKERIIPPGETGQHVLAVLRRAKDEAGFGTLKQVAHFDYQHGVSLLDGGKFRHWFIPA